MPSVMSLRLRGRPSILLGLVLAGCAAWQPYADLMQCPSPPKPTSSPECIASEEVKQYTDGLIPADSYLQAVGRGVKGSIKLSLEFSPDSIVQAACVESSGYDSGRAGRGIMRDALREIE